MTAEVVSWLALAIAAVNAAVHLFGRPGAATKALEIEVARLGVLLDTYHDSLDRAHETLNRVFDRLDGIERRRRPRS